MRLPPVTQLSVELATLVERPPVGPGWLHEIKLDGYRILARLERGKVQLLTRGLTDWTARAPGVARAVSELAASSAVLDGEVVSLRDDGVSDFQGLQNALRQGRAGALVYFAFDLLFWDGEDLRALPLLERKRRLRALLAATPEAARPHVKAKRVRSPASLSALRYGEHSEADGAAMLAHACKLGLEGIVSKRADSAYLGKRTKSWQKSKCSARQELVIGGYTAPGGAREHFGALLLGAWEGRDAQSGPSAKQRRLRYVGKVGTGFSAASLRDLHRRLRALARDSSAFEPAPKGREARDVSWVEPVLVAEIEFTEFTQDGRIRHPSFVGLREDKPAAQVVRERPRAASRTRSKARRRA
jgi:bifunctional non-homologous end joining protein LigD